MDHSLEKFWKEIQKEAAMLHAWQRRKRIRETIICVFYLLIALLTAYFSLFAFAACYATVDGFRKLLPVQALWNWLDGFLKADNDALQLPASGALGVAVIGTFLVIIVRLATRNVKGKATNLEPKTKNLETALSWVKQIDDRWWAKKPRRFLLTLLVQVLCVGAMTVTATMLCKKGTATQDDISDCIVLGVANVLMFASVFGVLKIFSLTSIPDEQCSISIISDLKEQIKKDGAIRDRNQQIQRGVKCFLEGNYAQARKTFENFDVKNCGDVEAVRILSNEESGSTIEALRVSYDLLWKAKDLGFYYDEVRKAVNSVLEKITPVVMETAQPDMLKIHLTYFAGDGEQVIEDCEEHAAYGHPDAIVLQIFAHIKFDLYKSPRFYEESLERLKQVKRRHFGIIDEETVDDFISELEDVVRENERIRQEKKRAESARLNSLQFNLVMPGPLSSWAEDSGWTDFRTGETLYRVDGHIVNGNGEEVSPAWWE